MEEEKNNSIGCGKFILIGCAVLLVLIVIGGALEGIADIFAAIPWYGHIFLSIGFCYIVYKVVND